MEIPPQSSSSTNKAAPKQPGEIPPPPASDSTNFQVETGRQDAEYAANYLTWIQTKHAIFDRSQISSGIKLTRFGRRQLGITKEQSEQIQSLLDSFFSEAYAVPGRIVQIESEDPESEKFLIKKLDDANVRIDNLLRNLETVVPSHIAAALVERMKQNEWDCYMFLYGLGQYDLELSIEHTTDFAGSFMMSNKVIRNNGITTTGGGGLFSSQLPWFLKNILEIKDE